MKRDKVYVEEVKPKDYETPACWGVCFVDSADNDYTFYPAIIFGDELHTIVDSDTRYVLSPDTALRLGLRVIEYSLRCMWYKKRKKSPKTFKTWFK